MVSSPSSMPTAAASALLAGADDMRLAATVMASGEAGSVLFAHGFGQTRHAWLASAAALQAHGYRSVAYDARGHGDSARNPAGLAYRGEQFTDDLIVVAGEMAPAPVLVAASMGGLFGLMAEARWPSLFRAMVLVDITPRWQPAGVERILAFMTAHPHGFASLDDAGDAIAAYLPQRSRKSAGALRSVLRQHDDRRWYWHWDPRLVEELARDSEQHQDTIAQAARNVRCPLLLISGGRSDLVTPQTISEFLSLVPHAQHAQLPDATHMLAGDDNGAFTATVLHYLDALPPASAGAPSAVTEHVPGASP
ncbi:alpha/beta hydrolase [Xanthomonas hyacinthi]|uniref:Alpha/beta hydrolase n=1 Tax=Xanthomonas hyacinthi TaxID=56455 RepID=A0A2S7F2Y5_9XANT|nr:alpha/beta fold hydrolase [Xanthomonas hyacinthi]KLD80229.1 peroxidase [Xanthomonas hyacinthi DSM 19077]PPU99649.1 alpha/beta hydrolase [Xanthomonas hyacinthi]QGY75786.1 alpha/beta hydrolase [Xanthomonas hyacinthi]